MRKYTDVYTKKTNQSKLFGYFVKITVMRMRHDNNSHKIKKNLPFYLEF